MIDPRIIITITTITISTITIITTTIINIIGATQGEIDLSVARVLDLLGILTSNEVAVSYEITIV